jgi:hypothetical protein
MYSYTRTDRKHDIAEAIEIDRVYGGVNFDPELTRKWLTLYHTKGYLNKTFILSTKLAERAKFDEGGVLPQFQSPDGSWILKNS